MNVTIANLNTALGALAFLVAALLLLPLPAAAASRLIPRRPRCAVVTKATTTATMTSGITASPSENSSSVASITEVIGSLSMETLIAPIPMATAGTSGRPGAWESSIPPAAPMNMAGNTGPPRKALIETP